MVDTSRICTSPYRGRLPAAITLNTLIPCTTRFSRISWIQASWRCLRSALRGSRLSTKPRFKIKRHIDRSADRAFINWVLKLIWNGILFVIFHSVIGLKISCSFASSQIQTEKQTVFFLIGSCSCFEFFFFDTYLKSALLFCTLVSVKTFGKRDSIVISR